MKPHDYDQPIACRRGYPGPYKSHRPKSRIEVLVAGVLLAGVLAWVLASLA